jgi:isopenicillin N synthase-like dioxygenase
MRSRSVILTKVEIYDSSHGWIRPENIAKQLLSTRTNNSKTNQKYHETAWRARYLVAMTGKWLEILTKGKVQSAIHRVRGIPGMPRLSAPLFLRPNPEVVEEAENLVLEDSTDIASSQAMLNEFLAS